MRREYRLSFEDNGVDVGEILTAVALTVERLAGARSVVQIDKTASIPPGRCSGQGGCDCAPDGELD